MSMRTWLPLVLATLIAPAATARAQYHESTTVDASTAVFNDIASIPERGIPHGLLTDAQGFAIVPGLIKAGFIVGGRYGKGIVVVRDQKTGGWSSPVFVTVTGGSVGFQAGAQATDLILVFRTRRSIDGFLQGRGKFTLGADASIAAGPLGRQAEAGTDVRLESEILSYSRSRGLFAGVSLEGAALSHDLRANVAYYGKLMPANLILSRLDLPAPESATRLKRMLSQLTGAPLILPAGPDGKPLPSVPDPVEPPPAFLAP
jgi:lipid-binding SYLF domain-containing protein